MFVEIDDLSKILPESVLPLSDHNEAQVSLFLEKAEVIIRDEFLKEGRDLDFEITKKPWLSRDAARVIEEMVAAAVMVRDSAGIESGSSSTGPVSDSVKFRDIKVVNFAGPRLTDEMRRQLTLQVGARSVGKFPRPSRWPERSIW